MTEICYWSFCLTPLDQGPAITVFGFSDFLSAVALLVIVYTITDIRYKFRIAVTPSPLYVTTFVLIIIIGFQSLLTEIWIIEKWLVPRTFFLSQSIWQGIFGALFLSIIITWIYYAFIRPPVFGNRNARKFARELYRYILRGNDDELKVIANELARSAKSIVEKCDYQQNQPPNNKSKQQIEKWKPGVGSYAHDVLLLIANRRFCRHIVGASPVTVQAFFEEVANTGRIDVPLGPFAKIISSEAVAQKESFLYVESGGYYSGMMGFLKPVSKAMYGNYDLMEALGRGAASPFYFSYEEQLSWDAHQWNAFCRAALITLEAFLISGHSSHHSSLIMQVTNGIEPAFRDLHELNDIPGPFESDIYKRLHVAVNFVRDAINLIDTNSNPPIPIPRVRDGTYQKNIYDYLAGLIHEMCFAASSVNSSPGICWSIHHNTVWSSFFGLGSGDGAAWKIVRFKVRRLLYDDIAYLAVMPNYKGSRILGFCLNVLGMKTGSDCKSSRRDTYALAKAVQSWTRKNYLSMKNKNPEVAMSVLIGRVSFDETNSRLVTTYSKGLRREAPKSYLDLEQPVIQD